MSAFFFFIILLGFILSVCSLKRLKMYHLRLPRKLGFFLLFFFRYDHELVLGTSVKNLQKAERLLFRDSLMTHAMVLTAVSKQVRLQAYNVCVFAPSLTSVWKRQGIDQWNERYSKTDGLRLGRWMGVGEGIVLVLLCFLSTTFCYQS